MLSSDSHFIIHGCPVIVNWQLDVENRYLFLWSPVSLLFWKNYTPIPKTGHMKIIANKKVFRVKIISLSRFGLKTIDALNIPVNSIEIINIEDKVQFVSNPMRLSDFTVSINVQEFKTHNILQFPRINSFNFIPKFKIPRINSFNFIPKFKIPIITNLNDFKIKKQDICNK